MPNSKRYLIALAGLLLLQLFIRAHNITELALFTDEYSHIKRATVIYDFDSHPALNSHGKFLFYFVPGIFDLTHRETALHLSRTIVALVSLITTSMIFLICRHLFDARAGFLAAVFYALVPYASFFERMALSDPWAGLIATMTVWMAIRFAQRPNLKTTFWLGTLMAFTLAAKLTMAFVVMIPAVTILALGDYYSLKDLWQRYGRLSILVNLVVVAWWLLVLIPGHIENQHGVEYKLYDNWLIEDGTVSASFPQKMDEWWHKMVLMVSPPLTVLFLVQIPLLLWKNPRRAGILLAWLVLAWFPAFFIIKNGSFQSRYLMAGVPALAAVFGVGLFMLAEQLVKQPRMAFNLAVVIMMLWAGIFALPFAYASMTDPTRLRMPEQDDKDYFWGFYNAYAISDAIQYVEDQAEEEPAYILLNTYFCLENVYGWERVFVDCRTRKVTPERINRSAREVLIEEAVEPVYLISEFVHEIPNGTELQWEKLASYTKPNRPDRIYTVWRITRSSETG